MIRITTIGDGAVVIGDIVVVRVVIIACVFVRFYRVLRFRLGKDEGKISSSFSTNIQLTMVIS